MLSALLSIHDVMPETRPMVSDMLYQLSRLDRLPPAKITLLVVPGKDWTTDDIRWLQALAQHGYPLAGHGWSHQAPLPRTLYHLLHSLLLSRNAAEHLSRSERELKQRVYACHHWFQRHDLPIPVLYVPPAWANGKLHWASWDARPFQLLETLQGVTDLDSGIQYNLPLTGYEADTGLRALFLRRFNQQSINRAQRQSQILRIGLHPHDLRYSLGAQALQHIASVSHFFDYSALQPSDCESRSSTV